MIPRGSPSFAAGLLIALAATAAVRAEGVGRCAWAKATPAVHQAFQEAYAHNMSEGMSVLASHDPELMVAVRACSGRADLPTSLAQGAVGSTAIQDGAATQLAGRHVASRGELDAAWARAPDAARACTRANAAKIFPGVTAPACPDAAAHLAFLQALHVSPQTDRPAAAQVLTYMNAKAQDEWAEQLIAAAPHGSASR